MRVGSGKESKRIWFLGKNYSESGSGGQVDQRLTPRRDSLRGSLSTLTPERLIMPSSSSSLECAYICKYGLHDVVVSKDG